MILAPIKRTKTVCANRDRLDPVLLIQPVDYQMITD